MIKGLLLGSASALALSALFVSAVTLIVPPPERNTRLATPVPAVPVQLDQVESLPRVPDRPSDPVQVAQREELTSSAAVPRVDLPAASEFNRPPEDGAAVTPSAERSQRPVAVSEGLRSGVAPTDTVLAETQSAAQPLPSVITGFGAVPEAGDAPAVPRVLSEDAPQTFGVVASGEDESALPESVATTQPEPVVTAQAEPEAIAPDAVVVEPEPVVVAEPKPVVVAEPEPVVVAEPETVAAEPEVKAPDREILLAEAPDAVVDEPAPIVVEVAPSLAEQPIAEERLAQQEPAQEEEIVPQPQDLAEETEAVAVDVPTATPTAPDEGLAEDGAVETAEVVPAEAVPAEAPAEATEEVARVTPVEDAENTPQTAADRARAAITFVENPVVPPRAEPEVAEETGPVVLPRRLVLDSARQDGAGQDTDSEDGEPQTGEVADGEAPVPDGPTVALVDFAAAFDNPDDLPLMSVVLIDDPSFDVAREDLLAFDFPVTFAIDPTRSDAAAAAAAYRAAGHEVVALAEIFPTGATAQDIEVAMSAMRQALPEAIGILDRASDGIVGNRTSLGALLPPMQEAGMGLLAYPDGLNSGVGTAQRAGVPATTLYRVLDEGGERAPVIVRFLDRATFEAAQDGTTVVVGRANSETVTALYSWRLGSRADQVAPAPLSAVLLAVSGS